MMSKRELWLSVSLACVVSLVLMAPTIAAAKPDPEINIYIGPYSALPGGEFVVSGLPDWILKKYSDTTKYNAKNGNASTYGVATFCLEFDNAEGFSDGGSYTYKIGSTALAGGRDKANYTAGDPLSIGTSILYSEFARGLLNGYNYGAGRQTSAAALQEAIWALEGELTAAQLEVAKNNNVFLKHLLDVHHLTFAQAIADAKKGANGVYVLNLYDAAGNLIQSQTILAPEPATLLLLGAGLGLLALAGSRSRKR